MKRKSGILLHITSLPGNFGIGEIGPHAHRWLDSLHAMGQTLWQFLPLNPPGLGNSPYSATSSFAGSELLISFDQLIRDGLLKPADINVLPTFRESRVDFEPVIEIRSAALLLACQNFRRQLRLSTPLANAFTDFCARESFWLDDYALYRALKSEFNDSPWFDWPVEFARRSPAALAEAMAGLEEEIETAKIQQFFFDTQWRRLKSKARDLGITLIGDIPIFVAHDSADVWANPRLFRLEENFHPTVVAGVPPDFFSKTGQHWGNPLYDWDRHAETGFAWWIARVRRALAQADLIRIDHFRGFASCWEIPASDPTAANGKWSPGPGEAFFNAMVAEFGPDLPIIAEDLGLITEDVVALREKFHLPGMRVLQFAFGSDPLAHEYLPENYIENCFAYTGTHDNNTTVGHFNSSEDDTTTRSQSEITAEQHRIRTYFHTDGTDIHWTFINAILHSRANSAVFPLQDLLGLDSDARMNTPGTPTGNWQWRFSWPQLTPQLQNKLLNLTRKCHRR